MNTLESALALNPLKVFTVSHKLGIGAIYRIQQAIPDIKRLELHSKIEPAEVMKFLKDNEGFPILLDALTADSIYLANIHIIRAAVDSGEVFMNSSDTGYLTVKVSGIVIAMRADQDLSIFRTTLERVTIVHLGA